ncbi:hypothetical protein BH23CHL2_BH23CHL2_03650 [soil metagenome]
MQVEFPETVEPIGKIVDLAGNLVIVLGILISTVYF